MSTIYNQLSETDIRLLAVNVHDGAAVSLDLHTYSRTSAPEYDVVSYAWGNYTSTTPVICNGAPLNIWTNLFTALPFICDSRPEPRTRLLWIDAICMNQNDRHEKAIHVPRMGEIYENATRTLIWLGEANDDSDLAMMSIESLTRKMFAITDPSSFTILQRLANHDLPPSDGRVWEALKALQLRPWFYRLWTLQEVVLSKDSTILCGSKSLPWQALLDLHNAALQANLDILVHALPDPKNPHKQSRAVIGHVTSLRQLTEKSSVINLPELLTFSVTRSYSIPVDRVWALLGLLNKQYQQYIQDARLVDYSEAAITNYHESFLGVTKLHIEHDTALAMRLIEASPQTVRNLSLPSWCPDWHIEQVGISLARWPEALAGFPEGQYRYIAPPMQVNEDSSLEICGFEVDTIECVTASAGQELLNLESYSWLIDCLEIIDNAPSAPYEGFSIGAIMSSTPTTYANGSPIHETWQRYMCAEEVLTHALYPPGALVDTTQRTLLRCNGRKFFRTKASRFGVGPSDLKENDILCAVYGARTIWALRPLESPKAKESATGEPSQQGVEQQEFELLGSAYTPSLWKGQAWAGRSSGSMQTFKLR